MLQIKKIHFILKLFSTFEFFQTLHGEYFNYLFAVFYTRMSIPFEMKEPKIIRVENGSSSDN